MKRVITILLALLMVLSLVACGGESSTGAETKSNLTDNLKTAASCLKSAENSIISASSEILEGWTTYPTVMSLYFSDDGPEQAADTKPIKDRATKLMNLRHSASSNLQRAKELIGTDGTGDFYNAVKKYYMSVNKFYTLISDFPEGYSKVTYSSTVADYKSECQSAYEEVSFYT